MLFYGRLVRVLCAPSKCWQQISFFLLPYLFFFMFVIPFNIRKYRFVWINWLSANSWNYLLGPWLRWQDSGWRWRYRDDQETRTRKDGCPERRRYSNRGWNGGGMGSSVSTLWFSLFQLTNSSLKPFFWWFLLICTFFFVGLGKLFVLFT